MTRTEFVNLSFFWGWWTFFEAVWISLLWRTRTRVLGGVVYRMPGVRRMRRSVCEKRVEVLLAQLERREIPPEARPDREELVDRWHRISIGRCVSVFLQAVPVLVVVLAFWWATSLARTAVTPFWMFAVIAGFGAVSITLMDVRAALQLPAHPGTVHSSYDAACRPRASGGEHGASDRQTRRRQPALPVLRGGGA
ncbi:hypothetical protein [Streptomyces sp. NBC_00344]|uniref:hypothetical protein n=1 Tax=Streptomyces sp. NBC_00344 TaxID=2975720 RepID=UPI002E2243B8